MGNDARIPLHFMGNRSHSFFKFRKSSAPNFSGSLSFQIGAAFSSSFPEDIRWQAAQSRSRQSLVRAHTDSPRREPECQSSEPGSTPPAAVWYRVRRFHPFPVRETLEGLWVLVGVVSAPGLSRVTSDCRGMRGSERPAPDSFAPEGSPSAGGRASGRLAHRAFAACRAFMSLRMFMGVSVRKRAFSPHSAGKQCQDGQAGKFAPLRQATAERGG